jgi:hypothetical protein
MQQINFNNNKIKLNGDLTIFSNMSTEEIQVLFPGSGMCSIPHSGFDRCCLTKSAGQTVPVGDDWIDVTWDGEDYDTNNMHSVVSNHERITVKKSCIYVFGYKIRIESVDKFSCSTRLLKNGVTEIPRSGNIKTGSKDASSITPSDIIPMINLDIADYLVLQVKHDYNQAKDILPADSFFSCERRY